MNIHSEEGGVIRGVFSEPRKARAARAPQAPSCWHCGVAGLGRGPLRSPAPGSGSLLGQSALNSHRPTRFVHQAPSARQLDRKTIRAGRHHRLPRRKDGRNRLLAAWICVELERPPVHHHQIAKTLAGVGRAAEEGF